MAGMRPGKPASPWLPLAVLLIAITGTGCVNWLDGEPTILPYTSAYFEGLKNPGLVYRREAPALGVSPPIRISFSHRHQVDGKPMDRSDAEFTARLMVEAFERVKRDTPFLAHASLNEPDPELLLDFQTRIAHHGNEVLFVFYMLTQSLVPMFVVDDFEVEATLRRPDGEQLGSYSATTKVREVWSPLVIPVALVQAFTRPGPRVLRETVEDVVIQLGDGLPAALAASGPP